MFMSIDTLLSLGQRRFALSRPSSINYEELVPHSGSFAQIQKAAVSHSKHLEVSGLWFANAEAAV